MNVGDKVKYTVQLSSVSPVTEYLGIIIAKISTTASIVTYKVSILALGSVIDSDGSDIVKIS